MANPDAHRIPAAAVPRGGRARRERHIFSALDIVFQGDAPRTPDGQSYEVALDPDLIPTPTEGRAACARASWEANPRNPVPRITPEKSQSYWEYFEGAPEGAFTVVRVTDDRFPIRLFAQAAWVDRVRLRGVVSELQGRSAQETDPEPASGTADVEVGGYRLERVIGRGGMSVVHEATQTRLNRKVAVKLLPTELGQVHGFRERFERESHIAAAVEHPNIVPIYDAGEEDGQLFIAMRLVRGKDLRVILDDGAPLETERALNILTDVADALDAAHAGGLIHRDVKPENILVENPGQGRLEHAYLSDFGLGRIALSTGSLTTTGQFLGTVHYAAPEQIRGEQVNARADLYALACIGFECFTGSVPYDKEPHLAVIYAHLSDPIPRPTSLRPELPSRLDQVFLQALSKDPASRYPTCHEFVVDLTDAFDSSRAVAAPPAGEHRRPSDEPANVATRDDFHKEMVAIYKRAKEEAGYVATRYIQLVAERGGLGTAKMLLASNRVSDGFLALWERKRLDLTVEALVLNPRFRHLFSETELEIAANRLREHGVEIDPASH